MEKRIGVYICHCGTNIASTVDVEEVVKYASTLRGVVIARNYMFMCSDPGQELILKDIKELKLNRVVVSSCSPHLHEKTFRNVCKRAGLNPYLFQMSNIREQCSWIHSDKAEATAKAKELVHSAVMRVYNHESLDASSVSLNNNTLVIGAGIAGIQAALDIANAGYKVYLVEKDPSIGGHMIQLDKTFPTLDCSACIMTPKMSDAGLHPNIELMTYSEVEEVSGYIGNYKAKIRKKARHVDEKKCTGCGICQEKCPWKTDSEYNMGLGKRKAIYTPFPQAVPNKPVIDTEICMFFKKGTCKACEKFCPADAIDFKQEDKIVEVEIGTVIVATGYDIFDPSVISQYGYKKFDNVYTGLEFERMVSASGPTGGQIILKNGETPESVAIVHCVGSRDKNYHEYCSRVCCMYGLKYAHLLKEKTGAEVYEIYIDMRCFGEGYEEFYERVSTQEGVKFIRGKVSKVTDRTLNDDEKGKLVVGVEDTLLGSFIRLPVDMVILCTALQPRADADKISKLVSVGRRADGFFMERHVKLDPVATMTDGIFIAGCCASPKDIPDTVAQAKAAAAEVLRLQAVGSVEIEPIVSVVDESICSGCGTCEKMCPYGALQLSEKEKIMKVSQALCKGCGACAGACPSGAISLSNFTFRQILDEVEALTD